MKRKKKIRKKPRKKIKKKKKVPREEARFVLPSQIKQKIFGLVMVMIAVVIGLSFFSKAGIGGEKFMEFSILLFGKAVFAFPLLLVLVGIVFWEELTMLKKNGWLAVLAIFVFILSISGILSSFEKDLGGIVGYWISLPFLKLFEQWVTLIIFISISGIAGIIIFYPLYRRNKDKKKVVVKEETRQEKHGDEDKKEVESRKSFMGSEVFSKFDIKKISSRRAQNFLKKKETQEGEKVVMPELELKQISLSTIDKKYKKPPLDLLRGSNGKPKTGDTEVIKAVIEKSLRDFGIRVDMRDVNVGPTVTQYSLKPADGVKLSKITSLSNNLALALAAHPIRIEAPIPGKSLVGIEVPNSVRAQVGLKDLLQAPNFQNSTSSLSFALGKDVSGEPIYADLAKMPHLLVAGSTGSGKTVFLNNLILSLLYKNSPEFLRLILIDPKRVEFPVYNNLPHLLDSVICNNAKAVSVLEWLIEEMERRFDILSDFNSRNIDSYNKKALDKSKKPLPYIVLIIDELADLMAAKGNEVEAGIVRLAQMSRAVGIHLVVATQRPSVEVITGLIKANITSRIAFQVASQIDSRTVFDTSGAEKLLGRGDMLFLSSQVSKPKRVQAALVTEEEVKKVVRFINDNNEITEDEENGLAESLREKMKEETKDEFNVFSRGGDALYDTAKSLVIEAGKASASFLQRKLRIGYARAARLIDMLEERGVVGPAKGAKPREIYTTGLSSEEESDESDEIDFEE